MTEWTAEELQWFAESGKALRADLQAKRAARPRWQNVQIDRWFDGEIAAPEFLNRKSA